MNNHDAMSIKEFCAKMGFSTALYFKLRKQGKAPPFIRIGKRVVILHADAEKWIEEHRQ